jgi:predicted transposase YbfD/YdcC
LYEYFGVLKVPCYSWILGLLKIIKPESLNKCFIKWVDSLLPRSLEGLTISFDGKSICQTSKMDCYARPLHIVSAYVAELGLTIGQQTVDDKSNEIPAMRDLIELLDVSGAMVVADALHCQKKTAKAIVDAGADYILNVKGNQNALKEAIEEHFCEFDPNFIEVAKTNEVNRDRIEERTAFVLNDIENLKHKEGWERISCIGAIHRQFTTKKGISNEVHYYISSRNLTPEELLKFVRNEWSIESMHWLLDVHLNEDRCCIKEAQTQQTLNMIRKIALNHIKNYKEASKDKRPISRIMLNCMLDCGFILDVLG